jgi:transcriptional regulator with PAS, ATPase and Fis domain
MTDDRRRVLFEGIVSHDPKMKECLEVARLTARADSNILILGETGVGKTLLAFAIHNESHRAAGPLIHCSTVSDSLGDSELFGHEQGAFTSADRDRRGKFELAHRGTLLLDEIGNMAPATQAKILRAVEDKEFERIGGEETIRADVRLIAATNLSRDDLLDSGHFRQDLFYRLAESVIEIPPLRQRPDDILFLTERFVEQFNQTLGRSVEGVSDVTLHFLQNYDWPGNIRELKNVIRSGVMNAKGDRIWLEDLNLRLQSSSRPREGADPDDWTLERVEREHIARVFDHTEGNKKQTAALLGISRPTLDRKLKKYGLLPSDRVS